MSIVDWMPTFCKLAGFQSADLAWDGTDLSSLLLKAKPLARRSIYIAGPRWRRVSLRSGRWKLVSDVKGKHELYNIATDPREGNDLAARQPKRLEEMLSELSDFRQRDNDAAVDQ